MRPTSPRKAGAPGASRSPAPDRADGSPASGHPETPPHLVDLGRLGRPHGLRGEMLLHLHNPASPLATPGREVWLTGPGGPPRLARLSEVRPAGRQIRVRLQGIETPETARPLVGLSVNVPRAALPAAGEGEWYVHDLVGCSVFDADGAPLGRCTAMFPTGSNEVLVVGEPPAETYVAFTDDFVDEVDPGARTIRLRRWEEI